MSDSGRNRMFASLGATNHYESEREENDYYATDPVALELLLDMESFSHCVWEPACGEGHLSKVLEEHGYDVLSTDLVDRGYGTGGCDFLKITDSVDRDIITNPPYKYAREFVEHAIDLVTENHKVAMLLKIQFLEGKSRRELFKKYPPKFVYVSTSRINCCKNGDFSKGQRDNNSAQAYAWFIWEKGYTGEPIIRWFNPNT